MIRRSREGKEGEPIAVKTNLGWTVYGGLSEKVSTSTVRYTYHICACNSDHYDNLHQVVKDYFSLDSYRVSKADKYILSAQDERSVTQLKIRTRFVGDRYETGFYGASINLIFQTVSRWPSDA